MTDEELCYRLRVVGRFDEDQKQAADRIEELVKERDVSHEIGRAFEEDAGQQRARAEAAEAALREIAGSVPYADNPWHIALAVLAELEKQ